MQRVSRNLRDSRCWHAVCNLQATAAHGSADQGIAMPSHTFRFARTRSAIAAIALLTPMFVADADTKLAPAQTVYVENLMGQHASRYMLGPFARVPLQCAHEMHGA
jgi:hypothetical protein